MSQEFNFQCLDPSLRLPSDITEEAPSTFPPPNSSNTDQGDTDTGLISAPNALKSTGLAPVVNSNGIVLTTREELNIHLSSIRVKLPLQQECQRLGIKYPKSGSLTKLRELILSHWYSVSINKGNTTAVSAAGSSSSDNRTNTTHSHFASPSQVPTHGLPLLCPPSTNHPGGVPSTPPRQEEGRSTSASIPPSTSVVRFQNQQQPLQASSPHEINPCTSHATAANPLLSPFSYNSRPPTSPSSIPQNPIGIPQQLDDESAAEHGLVREYGLGNSPEEILGFDDENDADGLDEELDDDLVGMNLNSPETFKRYQTQVRVEAAKRVEGNRREGGLRTQQAVVRNWKAFTSKYLKIGAIKDEIVDEHSLLLFIKYSAERPKQSRRGNDIPGTFIGASQLKKLFFGALRIRKEQEAADNTLTSKRRATSVGVWDAIKNRMNEALQRTRNGMIPGNDDAPDIVANTFLAEITPEEIDNVGKAFLNHRELRCAINGHLAWTIQHATGNRGDDLRSFKLAELQPWQFLHPNQQTTIDTVLILQGEEKAGKPGMKTTVNPVYSSLIAHLNPEKCALGALAFHLHFLYDVKDLASIEKIDWSLNKSWRQIRLLHSSKSYTAEYSAACLYNLYVKAFNAADLDSRLKLHLARHILGYLQEKLGVDSRETSKLGWKRGETYSDVYSPAIPKTAVLGCHGFKEHENYDPLWRHVHVPETFLQHVCPMAEEILQEVRGESNLRGTTGHWEMVIFLRPFLFQCGAAIFKTCPNSPIFKLPAFDHPDVRKWMETTFQEDLSTLQANAGSPVDLQRLQNKILQSALLEVRAIVNQQSIQIRQLMAMIERRTSVLSPAKGYYSVKNYFSRLLPLSQTSGPPRIQSDEFNDPSTPLPSSSLLPAEESDSIYEGPNSQLLACVSDSPKGLMSPRPRTQVDLVLPPLSAFSNGEMHFIWPPVLGQQGVTWSTVFKLVKEPKELWEAWKPLQSLDQYETVEALWNLFEEGEPLLSNEGVKSGMKPPLRLVEKQFGAGWRPGPGPRKVWERFREIPDWIDQQSTLRSVAPTIIINELEEKRGDRPKKGLNALRKEIEQLRKNDRRIKIQCSNTGSSQADSHSSLNNEEQSVDGSEEHPKETKKRRAPPIDPRRKMKVVKK